MSSQERLEKGVGLRREREGLRESLAETLEPDQKTTDCLITVVVRLVELFVGWRVRLVPGLPVGYLPGPLICQALSHLRQGTGSN